MLARMRGTRTFVVTVLALSAVACAHTAPAAEPDAETEAMAEDEAPPAPAAEEPDASGDAPKKEGAKKEEPKDAPPPDPTFTPDMTVDQAIAAVPSGIERMNIEQDALGQPLQQPGVFDACKPGSAHFKVKVAIWNGKVRSLNTVEFQF
jgi:hypothetical protein